MNLIPRDQVEWKNVKAIKVSDEGPAETHIYAHEMILPEPLASWDVFDYWERERFDSMEKNLKKGMVLFDIGTEQGWCNLIYAKFVGAENMVLIEPTQEFWPNIEATWHKNFNVDPKGFYDGLLSDKSNDNRKIDFKSWPAASRGALIDKNKYQYIHDNDEHVPELTLDEFVDNSGIIPDAITMDVEGAEQLILNGAKETIKKFKPLVWVSIHPDLGERDYGITRDVPVKFMEDLGYEAQYLATDHEEHWFFKPKGKK